MQKNDILILDIIDVTAEGSGVAKQDGMAVFIPLTAVGDRVKAKILKVKKNFAFAKVEEILSPSKNRISADCKVFNKCGGCVYRHINYKAEAELKQKMVYEAVKRIGGVDLAPKSILCPENTCNYRNKAQYPINSEGKAGFYAFHSHRIIPERNCLLQPQIFSQIIAVCEEWIKAFNISIYDETTSRGLLRHLYIRMAQKTGEILVTLVINGEKLPFTESLVKALKSVCKDDLKSVQLNINHEKTNVILGAECKVIYGQSYITDILCGIKVRLSPLSFYQVNCAMAERLYEKAAEYAKPENKNVIDLYCGAGTIGLSMAKTAKSIIGVEIVPEAVEDAKFNAAQNGIENARFICADAAEAAKTLTKENVKADVIIVDPPRKGCSKELIETISRDFAPERVVYVSCDPATLARDIKIFSELGYSLAEYTPADLFPRTAHVETVALLIKK